LIPFSAFIQYVA